MVNEKIIAKDKQLKRNRITAYLLIIVAVLTITIFHYHYVKSNTNNDEIMPVERTIVESTINIKTLLLKAGE